MRDHCSSQGALGPDYMWLLDTQRTIDEPWLPALQSRWSRESLLLDYGCEGETKQLYKLLWVTLVIHILTLIYSWESHETKSNPGFDTQIPSKINYNLSINLIVTHV